MHTITHGLYLTTSNAGRCTNPHQTLSRPVLVFVLCFGGLTASCLVQHNKLWKSQLARCLHQSAVCHLRIHLSFVSSVCSAIPTIAIKMALRSVMLLAVCLGAVAAAEGPSGSSLYETIQNSRSGASARVSAASYYLGTKKSCLLLKQIESCRVLGGDINPIPVTSGDGTTGTNQPASIAGGYFE